jgi:CheY-like chemotaxis protein
MLLRKRAMPFADARSEGRRSGGDQLGLRPPGSQHTVSRVTACAGHLRDSGARERHSMSSPSKQVLIVDNNEEESRTIASLLDRAGHCPTTTWSGLEALELLKSREFDLVLVSSYLPDLYVGDFFERFNHLPVQPCAIVIQEGEGGAAILTKVKGMIGEEIHSEH